MPTTTKEETIEDLQLKRQELAFEVQAGTKGAAEKLRKVEDKIAAHERDSELSVLAESERRRRDQVAAQQKAEREQAEAKAEYLRLLEKRVEGSERIEKLLAELTAALLEHRDLGTAAFQASAKWGEPNMKLRSPDSAVGMVHDYLGTVFPDDFIRKISKKRSLAEMERARLETLKHPERSEPRKAKAVTPEEPAAFVFAPVRTVVEIEDGHFSAFDDPGTRDKHLADAHSAGRSVFVGGHQHNVSAFIADKLKVNGFAEFIRPITEGNES